MTIWPALPANGVLSILDEETGWHEVYCLPAGICTGLLIVSCDGICGLT